MADVKWIKIVTDIFDDEKMLLIESLPDADSIIVIWFKLLTLAGKQNNSGVFMLNDKIPYTDEMFSTIFRRKRTTVQMALDTFEKFGMIEVINNAITIPNWSKHQTLDQIENRNEYMKNYMREYREKQKALASGEVNVNGKPNSKSNVNSLEEDIDKNKNKNKDIYIALEKYPIEEVIKYLNEKTGKNYRATTRKNQDLIKARFNEGYNLDDFKKVVDIKALTWKNDPNMNKFLRPETLFGTKFEGYLNESPVKNKTSNSNLLEHSNEELKRQQEYVRQKTNRPLPI